MILTQLTQISLQLLAAIMKTTDSAGTKFDIVAIANLMSAEGDGESQNSFRLFSC
jgi:hypothetical protein